MMLNRVDLPQPEGPITPRNSPGATPSDTSSTAVTTPSGVSNRLVMWSTTRMFPAGEAADNRSDGWISAAMASRVPLASLRLLLGFGPYSTSPLPHAPRAGGENVALTSNKQIASDEGVCVIRGGVTRSVGSLSHRERGGPPSCGPIGTQRRGQPSSAWNGRPARRHQFSQARLRVYGPVRAITLSISPGVRNLMSP